jgi:glycosyltransferase involved in cell wall biosynthesis
LYVPEPLRFAHQFNPVVAYGDAIGHDCLELQRVFWSAGVRSEVFAWEAKPEVRALVRDYHQLTRTARRDGLLLVHHSIGNDSVPEVASYPVRKAVIYHNITPAKYFEGLNEDLRRYSEVGREQLRELARVAEFGIADSEYNRKELEEAGFANTAVVPPLLTWDDFDRPSDPAVARELADERTAILAVGQILPHKAIHDVVAAFAKYRESDRTAHLYLVGPTAMSAGYLDRVRGDIRRLGLENAVTLTGSVTIEQLVAYYRGATAFLTLSEHEGFCVPLLEAMRSDLPVVASAAAAIPETLGDGGILLDTRTPEAVAGELERVVHDQALRKDLIEKGRQRVDAFSRSHVTDRLRLALAQGGWELPAARSKRVVVLSSDQRCGIHHYSLAVTEGLREQGHQVTFVGVRHLDTADLQRKLKHISSKSDAVLIEHEAGIFRDVPFVRALISLWRKRLPVILSMHELEPEKFHHYRRLSAALHYNPSYRLPLEILRMPWVALRMANWFLRYRLILMFMGAIPRKLIVHSTRSERWLQLLTPASDKRETFPLLVMPLENTVLPRNAEEKRKLRARFGLPTDKFIFVSPGFFFARKRYREVIEALPDDAVLVLSGTKSVWEPRYFDEIMALAKTKPNVVINTEYETMGEYVAASDAVVLYYENVFQSAVATQAVWAGLPCIFSDAEGFAAYHAAGPVVRSGDELATAMRDIQRPETYAKYLRGVRILRRLLSPERNAERYLAGID